MKTIFKNNFNKINDIEGDMDNLTTIALAVQMLNGGTIRKVI